MQSKWETNVWPRLGWIILSYVAALALASVAMLTSVVGFDNLASSPRL